MAKKSRVFSEEGGHGQLTDSKPVLNLGHRANQETLTQNPTGFQQYEAKDSQLAKSLRRDNNARGQYGQVGKLDSGITTSGNLEKWGRYSQRNSYQGDPAYKRGYPKSR